MFQTAPAGARLIDGDQHSRLARIHPSGTSEDESSRVCLESNLLDRAFNRISKTASRLAGRPLSFALALALILAWVASGPLFGFSDSWQLVVNTATTIVTFVMVFLIQNTQNRDTEAIQIKLDELIRATEAASNTLLDLEELDERTLDRYRERYEALALEARKLNSVRRKDEDSVREEDGA